MASSFQRKAKFKGQKKQRGSFGGKNSSNKKGQPTVWHLNGTNRTVGVSGRQVIKQKIRSLKRLIRKHPEKAAEYEVAMKKAQEELQVMDGVLNDAKKKEKVDERYKKIRFFETQKITRRIKKRQGTLARMMTQDLGEGEDMSAEEKSIRAELRQLERDLIYVRHFPSGHKYIALFPSNPPADPEAVEKKREELRKIINQQRQEVNLVDSQQQSQGQEPSRTAGLLRVQSSRTQEKRKRLETEALLRNASSSNQSVENAAPNKAGADPLFEAASDSEDAESGPSTLKEPSPQRQQQQKKKHARDSDKVELPQKRRRKKKKSKRNSGV